MTELIITLGLLAAFWSGFFIGFYKREGKPPEIPLPSLKLPDLPKKSEKPDREAEKENAFFS